VGGGIVAKRAPNLRLLGLVAHRIDHPVLDFLGEQQEHVIDVLSLQRGAVNTTCGGQRREGERRRYGLCGGLVEPDAILLCQLLSLLCAYNLTGGKRHTTE
jgi:hypothetical protein